MSSEASQYVRVLKTKAAHEDDLLLKEGVIGCGVGLNDQNQLGVVVYVSGQTDSIPTKLNDVPVFTEAALPDKKWTESGHITAVAAEDLYGTTHKKTIVGKRPANTVDAAVGAPISLEMVVPEILGLGIPRGVREAYLGMRVRKSGRTTGVTEGIVRACHVSLIVDYSSMGYGPALFVDQIATSAMAEPGDSGSLTVDEDLYGVGLLFAQTSRFTFHNTIQNVLTALDLEMWTEPLSPELRSRIKQVNREFKAGKYRTERWRPVPMGVSIGHYKGGTGTAGCLVKGKEGGETLVLSNAHVIAMPMKQMVQPSSTCVPDASREPGSGLSN